MSLVRAAVYDNGQIRQPTPGDLFANSESITSDATAATIAITGAQMATGILRRSGPGAGYADTFPTASGLMAALANQQYIGGGATTPIGIPKGLAFRFRIINTVAFADTVAVPDTSVVFVGGNTAIAASTWKDYLVTVLNGDLPQILQGTTANASAVVTGIADTSRITTGMLVTGTGVQANSTVLSVQPGIGITLSQTATASGTVALTFSPRYQVESLGGGTL